MKNDKLKQFDCQDTLSAYISSSSRNLYGLLDEAKEKIENAIRSAAKAGISEDLKIAVNNINSVKKFIADLNEACMPWQDRVKKTDGMPEDELLESYVAAALKNNSVTYGTTLSFVKVDILNIEKAAKKEGVEETRLIINEIEGFVRTYLRRRGDFVIKWRNSIIIILPGTTKSDALNISVRLGAVLQDYLRTKIYGSSLKTEFRAVNSPENGITTEDIIKNISKR